LAEREGDTKIILRLPEHFEELVSVFKEANINFVYILRQAKN
jgi:hypothetical protein